MSAHLLHVATGNAHKLDELRHALEEAFGAVELRGLRDFPNLEEPVEDGATLEENALIKARALHVHAGGLCVADDTGLMVDALDGAPGVYSARWAGEGCSYADNVAKLCKADLSVINIKVGAAARLPDGCCSQTMHATATARGGLALSPSPCSA